MVIAVSIVSDKISSTVAIIVAGATPDAKCVLIESGPV
jgi:hypothetical protein